MTLRCCPLPRATPFPTFQATHIFDGLEGWPSHLMYVAGGQLRVFERAEDVPELKQGGLLGLVERWLRAEKEERQAATAAAGGGGAGESGGAAAGGAWVEGGAPLELASWNNGWAPGRLTSSLKHASNAVVR